MIENMLFEREAQPPHRVERLKTASRNKSTHESAWKPCQIPARISPVASQGFTKDVENMFFQKRHEALEYAWKGVFRNRTLRRVREVEGECASVGRIATTPLHAHDINTEGEVGGLRVNPE